MQGWGGSYMNPNPHVHENLPMSASMYRTCVYAHNELHITSTKALYLLSSFDVM